MDLLTEILHTRSLIRAYPFLTAQATPFEELFSEWHALHTREVEHRTAVLDALARMIVIDDAFDRLCTTIAANLLANNNNNRQTAEYQRYFGDAPPSEIKRPVLGKQLETMRTWPVSLAESTSPALRENGRALSALIVLADQALTAHSDALATQANFELNTRKPFVDKLNGCRLGLYGQLAEMPNKEPEKKLSSRFANRFFLRSPGPRKWTIADAERSVFQIRSKLEKRENLLARLVEERERERRIRNDRELTAAAKALAEANQAQAAAQARMDEIRDRLLDAASGAPDDDTPGDDTPGDGDGTPGAEG